MLNSLPSYLNFFKKNKNYLFLFLVFCCYLNATHVYATATITIVNADGAGEGFNDTTAFTAVAGNRASTLGQARLNALQHAANLIGSVITSSVEIKVSAKFDALGGSAGSATLASAGADTAYRDFTNRPFASTWYVVALAEKLEGSNLNSTTQEINMTANSDLDGTVVLGTTTWYYGFDSNPGTDIDFITVAMHEILHGLGFSSLVNVLTGVKFVGLDDSYMRLLDHHGATTSDYPSMTNSGRIAASISDTLLHWQGTSVSANSGTVTAGKTGTEIHMYAPNPVESGSSVSHFNTTVTPNEMMEPSYTSADHNIGLAAYLLDDIGWGTTNVNTNSIDLQVTQTDSATNIFITTNETYNLVVTNNGASTATEVFITNMIPAGSTFVSATPGTGSCFQSTTIVTCRLGDLISSGTINIAIVVTLNTVGTNTNTVFVDSVNPDGTILNNESIENTTVYVNNVDMGVSQTNSAGTIDYASNETYAITVTNNSSTDSAISLVLISTLPSSASFVSYTADTGWSCAASSNIVTCNLASLALSTSSVVNITATLNTAGSNTNTVVISAANTDSNSANDSAAVVTTVGSAPPSIPTGTAGGGSCFIATAAYGSNMELDVRYLRAFRDQFLINNSAGRLFVTLYYRYSPAFADKIKDNQILRTGIRVLLMPFVAMSRHTVSKDYLDLQK